MSKRRQVQLHYSSMSGETKQFLQKICYRETASMDMTRYGFANDSHPIRLFLKPLRNQLEKIHGQQNQTKLKHRSVDGKLTPGTPKMPRGRRSQMTEITTPAKELNYEIETSINFLINEQKEQKRLKNKMIEESILKDLKKKKRRQKSPKTKKLE